MTRVELALPRISSVSQPGRSSGITVRAGDTLIAEVAETLSDGRVILNVGGRYISAVAEIPLMKGTTLELLVGRQDASNELRLKLVSTAVLEGDEHSPVSRNADILHTILRDMKKAGTGEKPADVPRLLATLLKALASEQGRLPDDMRTGIQNALRTFLKGGDEGIAGRLLRLTDAWVNRVTARDVQVARLDMRTPSMEELSGPVIRETLLGSGTVLEAKLRKMATTAPDGILKGPLPEIETDLKVQLLRMRESLTDDPQQVIAGQRERVITLVDQTVRDIETFQVLSKATGSWSTFLPLRWQDLREGEITLRRGEGESGEEFFSCRIDLDLRDLGKVAVTIVLRQRELFVTFAGGSAEFREMIDEHRVELDRAIAEGGLTLKGMNIVECSGEPAEGPERTESNDRLVSVKV